MSDSSDDELDFKRTRGINAEEDDDDSGDGRNSIYNEDDDDEEEEEEVVVIDGDGDYSSFDEDEDEEVVVIDHPRRRAPNGCRTPNGNNASDEDDEEPVEAVDRKARAVVVTNKRPPVKKANALIQSQFDSVKWDRENTWHYICKFLSALLGEHKLIS